MYRCPFPFFRLFYPPTSFSSIYQRNSKIVNYHCICMLVLSSLFRAFSRAIRAFLPYISVILACNCKVTFIYNENPVFERLSAPVQLFIRTKGIYARPCATGPSTAPSHIIICFSTGPKRDSRRNSSLLFPSIQLAVSRFSFRTISRRLEFLPLFFLFSHIPTQPLILPVFLDLQGDIHQTHKSSELEASSTSHRPEREPIRVLDNHYWEGSFLCFLF